MTSEAPLHGIRVTSLAINVPGPVAVAKLVALGAQATKVEPPDGDFLARAAPAWYTSLAEGQRVIRLDLKSPEGRASFEDELGASDVLIVSSRPSALARLGLGREKLVARHPRLCVVSIVGHPSPHAERAGHDLTYQAEAGLVAPPSMPVTLSSDLAAASEAVSCALALLVRRARTGDGGWREVALAECAYALAAPLRHGLTAADGILGGGFAGYATYAARDGTIAVAALEPHFLARLLSALSLTAPDAAAMASAFRQHPVRHWEAVAKERDIPMVAVSASSASS